MSPNLPVRPSTPVTGVQSASVVLIGCTDPCAGPVLLVEPLVPAAVLVALVALPHAVSPTSNSATRGQATRRTVPAGVNNMS
ncbi:MAG TPA: hypothetical protein VGJ13_18755 [Pseudonocardiaceae bacterium]